MAKIIDDNAIVGRQGVNLVERTVLQMKHVWNPTTVDAGIDGVIEFRDPATGAMSNLIVQVQVKSGDSYVRAETDTHFTFYADKEDLEHWRSANTPVILVVCRPNRDEAYYADVKSDGAIDQSGKTAKIVFNKTEQRFDDRSEPKIRSLAVSRPWGFHLRPRPSSETLTLNYMPVRLVAEKVFVGATEIREYGELFACINEIDREADRDFVLHEGKIFSVSDLREGRFRVLSQPGTIESLDLATWIDENPSLGVDLMQRMLQCIARRREIAYSRWDKLFFARPTKDGSERTFRIDGRRTTYPSFYKRYASKKDPSRIAYHRHRAFSVRFLQFEQQWFAEVSPSYLFTSDGRRKHPYHEDYLKKINEIEGPPSIFGHLKMWGHVLQPVSDLGANNYPHMELQPLREFSIGQSIDDKAWKPDASDEEEAASDLDRQTDLWGAP